MIIAQGRIIYDGSLEGILDRFGGQKVISLLAADGRMPDDLDRYGEVLSIEPPRAKLRIERSKVTEVLSAILARHAIEDVSVEDPPLEEIIAKVFKENRDEG